ncbi:MAG: hypothetical protein R2826_11310 [Thermoleophilia bacterium]
MAVLVEGISVVVRRDAIDERHDGGLPAFTEAVPSVLFAADDYIAVVGFQAPEEAEAYCVTLAEAGINFGDEDDDDVPTDVAVVDQFEGILTDTDWLECARFDFDEQGHEITVCWFITGEHLHGEIDLPGEELDVAVPAGWEYEHSLSAAARYIPEDEAAERLEFLRHDPAGYDIYRDRETGEELCAPCEPHECCCGEEHGEDEDEGEDDEPAK